MPSIVVMGFSPIEPNRKKTRAHRIAINMHRARATLRYAATKFRAGHPEHVAQDPQQRRIAGGIKCTNFTIYLECWHGSFLTTVSSIFDRPRETLITVLAARALVGCGRGPSR
jgi:hypothetical protein